MAHSTEKNENQMIFSDRQWNSLSETYRKWWAGTLGRALVGCPRRKPDAQPDRYSWWATSYPFDVPADAIINDFKDMVEATDYPADSYPYFLPNFGPGVLAVPLGSIPHIQPDTVWFEPIPGVSIEHLKIKMNLDHPWWKRVLEVTRTACEKLPRSIPVTFTDIGVNLDILASLVGTEQLLTDLLDHPGEIRKTIDSITDTWFLAYEQLAGIIAPHRPGFSAWAPTLWAPGKTYMLSCDFSYMISPAMFEQFVLPDLTRYCDYLEYSFYHLDGPGQLPHLPQLLGISKLRGIQWVPGASNPQASDWTDVLKKIIDAGKLLQVFVNCKGALKILDTFPGEYFSLTILPEAGDQNDLDRLLNKVAL